MGEAQRVPSQQGQQRRGQWWELLGVTPGCRDGPGLQPGGGLQETGCPWFLDYSVTLSPVLAGLSSSYSHILPGDLLACALALIPACREKQDTAPALREVLVWTAKEKTHRGAQCCLGAVLTEGG